MSKYTEHDFDRLFEDVEVMKTTVKKIDEQLASWPDFNDIEARIKAFPDFSRLKPIKDLDTSLSTDKVRLAIETIYLSTGCRTFSTKQLKAELRTVFYNGILWKLVATGELIKEDRRGMYTVTDKFIEDYIG